MNLLDLRALVDIHQQYKYRKYTVKSLITEHRDALHQLRKYKTLSTIKPGKGG